MMVEIILTAVIYDAASLLYATFFFLNLKSQFSLLLTVDILLVAEKLIVRRKFSAKDTLTFTTILSACYNIFSYHNKRKSLVFQ